MTYINFRSSIEVELKKHPAGKTWKELRDGLKLPYDQPCPEWMRKLEKEIGLAREKGKGNALVWRVETK